MKKCTTVLLLAILALTGCNEAKEVLPKEETVKAEIKMEEYKYEYKEDAIVIGEVFKHAVNVIPNKEPEFISIAINDIKHVNTFPLTEERKEMMKENHILGTQTNQLNEIYEEKDWILIDWKIENSTSTELRNYPTIFIEDQNGRRIATDNGGVVFDQLKDFFELKSVLSYQEAILSPDGFNEGVIFVEIPKETTIGKVYIRDDTYDGQYTDIHHFELSDIETIDVFTP